MVWSIKTNLSVCVFLLTLSGCVTLDEGVQKPEPFSRIDVTSDFEGKGIDPVWKTSKLAPGSWSLTGDESKSGNQSIKITLIQGAIDGMGEDGKSTERAELKEEDRYHAHFDHVHWYCFSFLIPHSFPSTNTRLILGQWKQVGDRNPVLAQRLVDGSLVISAGLSSGKKKLFALSKEETNSLFGTWVDMAYRVQFSGTNGSVRSWINGKNAASYKGVLGYDDDIKKVYFKFGLYRDSVSYPMTIYFDNYHHKSGTEVPPSCVIRQPS